MLNFRQVEAFRAVMLSGSMTQAARDLNTTQPNVSRVIAQLEKRIGLRLFERIAGKLAPTREGEIFFRDVERAFSGLRGLEQSAATLGRRGAGHLRLAAVPSFALVLVPRAMRSFAERFPDVTVSLHATDSVSVCQAVASGQADVGVASEVFSSPGIGYRVAHEARAVCLVPAGHRLAGGSGPLRPDDLADEPFITLSPQDSIRKKIDAAFAEGGDRRRMAHESPFSAAICQMVALGMGVSIANPSVASAFAHLPIVQREFLPEIVFPTYLVWQPGAPASLLAREFSEVFMQTAQSSPSPPSRR
ncbi:LysR substrate-binding domain-containing protein [Xylophilus sp. GOD-11R]|uniref:LysR substrate-binding domain-containing protein n=1 Tax=Xylophilus sp. GOD-11R TaxID=3089814 RepID=UPI00298CB205|nr:LysR substrate-binding domain-containing protein [Xylophilus sp. GOD-11R]WPB55599.1 LysR substrate-binding domain-containing protein [Xylophilus sp. GOD-11R]